MKKCEKCKFYFGDSQEPFEKGVCASPIVIGTFGVEAEAMDITAAREMCDREGDGHFVYFEPLTPAAGAAFELSCNLECGHSIEEHAVFDAGVRGEPNPNSELREVYEIGRSVKELVQITREQPESQPWAMAATQ